MENNDIETLETTEATVKETAAVETKVEPTPEPPKEPAKEQPAPEPAPEAPKAEPKPEPAPVEEDEIEEKPKKSAGTAIVIILLLLSILALSTYIISDRLEDEKKAKDCNAAPTEIEGTKDPEEEVKPPEDDPTKAIEDEETIKGRIRDELKDEEEKEKADLKKEVERIYSLAYSELEEGTKIEDTTQTPYVKKDKDGDDVEYYPYNGKILEKYFTAHYIEEFEIKCVEEHDGIEYLVCDTPFIFTIFGVTEQGERKINVIDYDDNYVFAISEEADGLTGKYGNEIIVFKKDINTWKIEMHQ